MYKYRHNITLKNPGDENISFYVFTNIGDSFDLTSLFNFLYSQKDYSIIFYEEDNTENYSEFRIIYPDFFSYETWLSDNTWIKWFSCASGTDKPYLDLEDDSLAEFSLVSDEVMELSQKLYKHVVSLSGTNPGGQYFMNKVILYSPNNTPYIFGESFSERLAAELVLTDRKAAYLENAKLDPEQFSPESIINKQMKAVDMLTLRGESGQIGLIFKQRYHDIYHGELDPENTYLINWNDEMYIFPVDSPEGLPSFITFTDTVTEV